MAKFLYGLAKLEMGTVDLGFVDNDSFDMGGQKATTTEINAAQVKGVPVLVIPQKNGMIKPTFNLIDLKYENLQKVMGGTLVGTSPNYTGWKAPVDVVRVEGAFTITSDSGQKISIPNGLLLANLSDKLTTTGVVKIACEITPQYVDATTAPYSLNDIDEG